MEEKRVAYCLNPYYTGVIISCREYRYGLSKHINMDILHTTKDNSRCLMGAKKPAAAGFFEDG
ncbi:hypothetical protein [Kluyvera genomosp. 1]|uniref:hypothetical protein n=1 Tax=Kluyvera genomosp. 1 TaxID=2774053 RepID=UPI000AB8DCCD|nr:hypothetical protein [Kluyvera genomosp. 1]